MKMIDNLNKKYNNMLVIEILDKRMVKCKCDCGKKKICDLYDLRRNRIKGCGCQRFTTKLKESRRKLAYKLIKKGILNKGGDHYPKKHREFRYFYNLINRSNRKACFVTIEDLIEVWNKQNGICPYSKIKLNLPTHSNPNPNEPYYMASVDRIDSSKPYTKDNIQFVSRTMNYAKNSMTHEQTINFLKLIIENYNGEGGTRIHNLRSASALL